MPTTYTHHIFGNLVYRGLPQEIQRKIRKEANLYQIGLHGPDILFYYRPFQQNRVNGLGHAMHKETAAGFFEQAKQTYRQTQSEALFAYVTGFICHFMLDSACHPIVDEWMKKTHSTHAEIETELDRMLMERTHKDPMRFHPSDTIRIRRKDAQEIASVLGMEAKTVLKCLRGMKFYTNLTVCSSERKRRWLLWGMKKIGVYEETQGRVMRKRKRKRCLKSTQELFAEMRRCVPETIRVITRFWESEEIAAEERFLRNYL